jgi:DNA-binding transcriptional LysR family regulator
MQQIDAAALSRKNLALLIVFDVVAELRSVTLAAEQLSLSQPALSHSLGKLRHLFNDPLFVRGRGMLLLTPRAEKLVEPVRALLAGALAILSPVRPAPAGFARNVTVAMDGASMALLGDALVASVRALAPRLRLRVESVEPRVGQRLDDGSLDLAIGQDIAAARRLCSVELLRDRLVGVIDAAHPLAAQARADAVSLAACAAYPLVLAPLPAGGPDPLAETLSRLAGAQDIAVVPECLAVAAGVLLPRLVIFGLPLKTAPLRHRLVWHPATDGDPVLSWLREVVRTLARQADAPDATAGEDGEAWPPLPAPGIAPVDRPRA